MTHLPQQQYDEAKEVLEAYHDIFAVSNSKIGRTNITQFDIDATHTFPVSTPLRRVPLHQQHIVTQLLEHYKQLGLIEPIDSSYHAATVLIEKKNVAESAHVTDRYRLCIDYRFLNKTLPDSGWPSPSLQQCLDAAFGSKYLSALDFNSGYHQIPCTERAKYAIAFSPGYGFGQWTWNVMPQGIKPVSHAYQRTIDKTFFDMSDSVLPPFFDDVTVKGRTFPEHKQNVIKVLQRIRETGFTLNALKCYFFQHRLPYLGHIIDNGKITLDPSRIKAIHEFPIPTTVKSLCSFLGMAQFFDRFVPYFSTIAAPLHELTKSNTRFQ